MPCLVITPIWSEACCDKCRRFFGNFSGNLESELIPQMIRKGWTVSKNESGSWEFICPPCAAKGLVELFKLYFET